ncbi:hypothetical protein [Aneurinibacillus tyrosinisolvens]|uniref:hypothetical protein n=1 Tax=Aneurinibacillus tyrosinisolvens TaxID=1443435 RepID=UPI00063F1E87|nr:hypothetical protein [Aneurinibacillus tyrosinisolvens]
MNQSNAIHSTMHERVAIIKVIGSQPSKEEITMLLQACLKALGVEATGDMKVDAQTIVSMDSSIKE